MRSLRLSLLLVGLLFPVWLSALVVGTYNVRNYNIIDRPTESGYFREYPKPESEKQALRNIIRTMDADILCLQEMGPEEFVLELLADLKDEQGTGVAMYPYYVIFNKGDPVRRLVILSKLPFEEKFEIDGLRFNYFGERVSPRRGLLGVSVKVEGEQVFVYNVHLSSRFTYRDDDFQSRTRRTGEATVIRDYLRQRHGDPLEGNVILVGDFNDEKATAPLQRFLQVNRRPLFLMLEAEDSRGHRWTHFFARQDNYSRVDYILISPELKGAVVRSGIHDDADVLEASDHRPVWAEFRLAKERP